MVSLKFLCSLCFKSLLEDIIKLESLNPPKGELYREMYLLVQHSRLLLGASIWWIDYFSCHTCPAHNARSISALFVKTLTKLGSPTPGLTPTLSLSSSLLHCRGSINVWHGLNTTRRDWVPHSAYTHLLLPSLWVKPTPLLGKRCDKTWGEGKWKIRKRQSRAATQRQAFWQS